MADEKTIAAVSSLAQAGSQAYSSVQAGKRANESYKQSQDIYTKQQALYDRLAEEAKNPDKMMAGIMKLKEGLSAETKKAIMNSVADALASRGLGDSPGIIQEAIARALTGAELPLFQQAVAAYQTGQSQAAGTMPKAPTYNPPTGLNSNPFQALLDYYKSEAAKKVAQDNLDAARASRPLPGASDTFAGLFGSTPSLPPEGG